MALHVHGAELLGGGALHQRFGLLRCELQREPGPALLHEGQRPGVFQAFWREAIDLCEPQVIVAHLDNKIMGFAGFDRSRDKGTPATTGEVWALFADPVHWDKGVGLALWDATRDGLQEEGCTKATLWCYLRNERALRFFELAGFKRELGSARTTEVGGARIEEIRLHRSLV